MASRHVGTNADQDTKNVVKEIEKNIGMHPVRYFGGERLI